MTIFEQTAKWLIKLETAYESIYDTKIGRIAIWTTIGIGLLLILGMISMIFKG